jgi:hypothetical protein
MNFIRGAGVIQSAMLSYRVMGGAHSAESPSHWFGQKKSSFNNMQSANLKQLD